MFSADLGTTPSAANYIEDVFSTYLFTANGSTQTITNNIDLSTNGGLVFFKGRSGAQASYGWGWFDTARGTNKSIASNSTAAQLTSTDALTAFTTTGFTLGADSNAVAGNTFSGSASASWTFRKQAKFFDVVTYTGDGTNTRNINHNLGSAPGSVFVKATSTTSDWFVWHRSLAAYNYMTLNTTAAAAAGYQFGSGTQTFSSSVFTVGAQGPGPNVNGVTYVAYLFAHDAGGFGAAGTDNVISCGSYTGDGTDGQFVNVGFEVQWLLVKRTNAVGDWFLVDVMRGALANGAYPCANLYPNLSSAETLAGTFGPDPRGFRISASTSTNASGSPFIYIAIRRGPMKTPTSGTSVFGLNARTGTGANATVTGGQTDDAVLIKNRGSAVGDLFAARLTGTGYMETSSTAAEVAAGTTILQANPWDVMDGVKVGTTSTITNASSNTFINYLFRRAPGFFDVVCYTGTGSSPQTINHNLGVAPELIISRRRSPAGNWFVGANFTATDFTLLYLNDPGGGSTTAYGASSAWVSKPANNSYTVANSLGTSGNPNTFVSYLFATSPGVSKVGSYFGTGALQTINCGFSAGARFVLIKRTDSAGDWYVWDSARGISSGNDPYLLWNSNAAEVTGTNYVDTTASGFQVTAAASTTVNASFGIYIFLAIA